MLFVFWFRASLPGVGSSLLRCTSTMKKHKPSFRQLWCANVFDACNDKYVKDAQIDTDAVLRSKHHEASFTKNKQRKIIVDTEASDYEDIFIDKGTPIGPDDILEAVKPLALKIPTPRREEIKNLPLSDLLRALHYYSSYSGLQEHSCDETALLSLGMLVEQWADELVTDDFAKMFAEPEMNMDGEMLPRDEQHELDALGNYTQDVESEESDIISLDLEPSDEDHDVTSESEENEENDQHHAIQTSELESGVGGSTISDATSISSSELDSSSSSVSNAEVSQKIVPHNTTKADLPDESNESSSEESSDTSSSSSDSGSSSSENSEPVDD